MEEEIKHSKIGASSCKRWWNCPGSVRILEQIPKDKGSIYAAEGTVAHILCEKALKGKWGKVDLQKELGKVYVQEGFKVTVDQEMLDAVRRYTAIVWDDHRNIFKEQCPEHYDYLKIEQPFHLKEIDEDAYGTNDACIAESFKKLIVYDFKYGMGVKVFAEENLQMLYYALGAYLQDDFTTIELVIVQPRVENGISRWTIDNKYIENFAKELKEAIARTRDPKAPLKSGDWCKFCPAQKIFNGKVPCTLQTQLIQEIAVADFEILDPVALKEALVSPAEMSGEHLAKVIANADILSTWISGVKAYAEEQAQKGTKIPGFKLVDSYGNRSWKDEAVVINKYRSKYGMVIFGDMKLKSPAQMEKIVPKEEILELVQIPYKGTILVAEKDKRPEAKSAIDADFDIL